MRRKSLTQTGTTAWAASSSGVITDIDKLGVITRIEATMEITPSGSLVSAHITDALFRPWGNLKIEGAGVTYFSVPDDGSGGMGGTLLHYMNRRDFLMGGHGIAAILAPNRTYNPVSFVLHAGVRPRVLGYDNPFDLSGVLPASQQTSLRANWVTTGNAVMDSTTTISSAVMRYKLYYIMGTDEEIRGEMIRQGIMIPADVLADGNGRAAMIPAWESDAYAHTATAADYSVERIVPVDGYLKRINILCQEDTATRPLRAADETTGIRLKIGDEVVFQEFADGLFNQNDWASFTTTNSGAGAFQNSSPHGVIMKDLRPHGHPDYGLNMRRVTPNSAKLGLTITTYTSGDDSLILYEKYIPYYGVLGS